MSLLIVMLGYIRMRTHFRQFHLIIINVYVIISNMLSSCKYLCSYVNRYLLTCFVYLNQTENSKKESSIQTRLGVCTYFGMNETTFVFMFLIHACSEFHFLSMHVINLEQSMTRDYYFTISRKRGSMEILARSSISPEFQLKWILK